MRISDFDFYKDLLIEKSGLYLRPDQSFLLDSRLTPVAKKWGYPSLHSMSMALRAVPSNGMIDDIVEAMTINEAAFFCDRPLFSALRDSVLPYITRTHSGKRHLKIWCAGVATRQEAYSAAITLKECEQLLKGWKTEILATDISTDNLQRAAAGLYSQSEIQRGLPTPLALKYFTLSQNSWQARDDIRRMITFQQHNLLDSPPEGGPFNIILCRHVITPLAYDRQSEILECLAETLSPDGFLFLGQNEALPEGQSAFVPADDIKELYVLQEGRYNISELKAGSC